MTVASWRAWLRPQDAAWLALFWALGYLSPRRSDAELEMLAALAVLQVLSSRLGILATWRGTLALNCLRLLLGFLLIGVSGGILSSYHPILLLPVISAATSMGPLAAALFTLSSCAAYLFFLPYAYSLGYDVDADVIRDVSLRVMFLPVVGYLTYQLAQANRAEASRAQAAAAGLAQANRNLQEAEAAVRRSERLAALGQLTAGLAHELRNPMGTMKASAEMLRKRIPAEDEIGQELAGYVSSEVDRTNSLISRFLEFARPLELRRAPCDINGLADRAAAAVERRHEISIHRNFAPDSPVLWLDGELMERVLINLLQNAVQASPAGAAVTVKTRAVEGGAEIAVIDRGSGIRDEDREQIFNPFFTTKADGVGLGLAIVSKIVDEHGGRLEVDSEAGKGSVFRVLLVAQA